MKVLVLAFCLGVAYARPGVTELSGSYLPGVVGGSNILSTNNFGGSTFGGSSFGGYNGIGGIGGIGGNIGGYNGAVSDQRHVFFYAAPDDEGPARFRVNIAPSSARNTKIIFVKAPSSGGVIPEVIAPPSQSEDKTLVYVLVKKQQQGGQITIPSSLGVKQAKPEVFFIKYRNPQEAQQAVIAGVNGQSVGDGLSDLGSEGSFVRTLSYGGFGSGLGGLGGGGLLGGGGGLLGGGGGLLGGGDGGISIGSGGSHLLGGTVGGGIPGGVFGTHGTPSIRYGTPGASGPYKR